jgi:hypothetical protein
MVKKGGGFGTTFVLAVLFVVLATALAMGLARYGERSSLLAPLMGKPTQTTAPVVVEGIQRLNELSTVRWTESVVVTEETSEGVLPQSLNGEKLILVATGKVEAGVNLDELGQDDVRVEGEQVTVELPEARILSSSLDEEQTKLYDRERGLLVLRGDDTLIEEARRDAGEQILEAAQENGILKQAQGNAEDSIRAFVSSLGYKEVTFS